MSPPLNTLSFYLPGLVHQFGNLLLTVQGHVMNSDGTDIGNVQQVVAGAVDRGGASLQVMRVLMGEQIGAVGCAAELVDAVLHLGRVAARELGIIIESRSEDSAAATFVSTEPFVAGVSEALWRWVHGVRSGGEGVATVSVRAEDDGGVLVLLGYEPPPGGLPFPIPCAAIAKAVSEVVDAGRVTVTATDKSDATPSGVSLQFHPAGLGSAGSGVIGIG